MKITRVFRELSRHSLAAKQTASFINNRRQTETQCLKNYFKSYQTFSTFLKQFQKINMRVV